MDCAKQRFFHVYHQVQTWLGYSLDALEWGWKIHKDKMVPQFMTQPPASSELLIYISDVDARKMVVCIQNVHVEDTVCLVLFRVRSATE